MFFWVIMELVLRLKYAVGSFLQIFGTSIRKCVVGRKFHNGLRTNSDCHGDLGSRGLWKGFGGDEEFGGGAGEVGRDGQQGLFSSRAEDLPAGTG